MATQRADLRRLLRQSPSRKSAIAASVADVYPDAVEGASIETGLAATSFPASCPFSVDEILERTFLSD